MIEEIKDIIRKKELEGYPRIKLKEIPNWNTSWAKDKYGKKDNINLIHALFFEYEGKEFVWFPTEKESEAVYQNYKEIAEYNRKNDNSGKEYQKDKDLQAWVDKTLGNKL